MEHIEKAKTLVAQMTLAEKANLCSGKDFWMMKGVERLGLPEIMVTDGPHGLRKQRADADHLGINQSVPAVCFPTASATACSFDRQLLTEIGQAIAEECRQESVAVLLGPGINIKRSPLCGRNFEYFSEDPFVSGELGAAFIDGVQSQNVGVSLKHFAANNQEKRRMVVDSVVDERTLREIYLAGFEQAVKKARPWTVMCSYNRLFGQFASVNKRLLTEILRDEWGFEGVVVSDWGATANRVRGLEAGLDLEMPHLEGTNDARIVQAVESGMLPVEILDAAAVRLTAMILRAQERQAFRYDADAHHALARRAAAQSAVLLKNEDNILPGRADQKAAVIGAFAVTPRYQGAGSSKIQPLRLDSARDELKKLGLDIEYAEGYRLDTDLPDEALVQEACRVAEGKDIVYIFAGLPDRYEAETFDRESMKMPESHVRLIEAVSRVNQHVVVILHGGAPMELVWADGVQGILLMYLGGEACGGACADLLLGVVNPGGKLAETWPFTAADASSHVYFPGYPLTVEYREGLFVGYRYYDTAQKAVRYPFGYGLAYTRFEYSNLRLSADQIKDSDTLTVSCTVTNVGSRAGSEAVQLYVSRKGSVIIRAEQELKGFEKLYLEAGQSQEVRFTLSGRDFAYYNTELGGWHVEDGEYEVRASASSRDLRLSARVRVVSSVHAHLPDLRATAPCYYDLSGGMQVSDDEFKALLGRPIPARERQKGAPHTINSSLTDIQDKWLGRQIWNYMRKQIDTVMKDDPEMKMLAENMLVDAPLRALTMMSNGGMSVAQVEGLVEILNGHLVAGIKLLMKRKP
ncbi:MAG TPA: glycoside hydrolase family 3 C-terminal domain-containing protein [Anaerolineales bacterium]|nr:glycoside hydrolase family 3 C-terminal domain-containing protein [Anaerolineales bacterium]